MDRSVLASSRTPAGLAKRSPAGSKRRAACAFAGLFALISILVLPLATSETEAGAQQHLPSIEYGMAGTNVNCVQEGVKGSWPGLVNDGYYGSDTFWAVWTFQYQLGLGIDGKVGPQTGDWVMNFIYIFSSPWPWYGCYSYIPTYS